ncbi:MAG: hypothetical protein KTR31_27150 [Myxococcales bacterium]|nr:hypothetical protein [Myxococcales bacterium]
MWILVVIVGITFAAYVAMGAWHGRLLSVGIGGSPCPECGGQLQTLTPGPGAAAGERPRSYELRVCASCSHVSTTVHGARSLYAYCPSCRQMSLEVHAKASGSDRIDVNEQCQICGFQAELDLERRVATPPPDDDDRSNNVIPFPKR